MGLRIIYPKRRRVKKVKSRGAQEVLDRLNEFLTSADVTDEPVEILCRFWEDQQTAISYKELRETVREGYISSETLQQWAQDYSYLVKTQLNDMWVNAIKTGATNQPLVKAIASGFVFNTQTPGILLWLDRRGADFVTSCTQQQKDAIAALLSKKMIESHTVDELARMIRPCIGLTEGQSKANARYYDSIVANLRKEHPRMSAASIRQKALDASTRYAERQHRERAFTIAQTESAFAYNQGADAGIRQAREQNLIRTVKKRWSTSGDDGVCDICSALEGTEVDMDSDFTYKEKTLFDGQHMLPPAHPRCACAVEYIEVSPPTYTEVDIPQMNVDITRADSLRTYSVEEIDDMAAQTEKIASQYIAVPSKWSGKMVIDDEGIINSDGSVTHYGKLWNCDIVTKHETAPAMILHEQIHARSISHYGQEAYLKYGTIEEASVQFVVDEICRKENVEIIESLYDDNVEALRKIGKRIGVYPTDYEFAKCLIEMPVSERLDWLSSSLYDTLSKDPSATLEEYQELADLLNMLY